MSDAVFQPPSLLPSLRCRTGRVTLALLAVSPLLFGMLAQFLGQDINWDLRNYHWYNAWALVTGRYQSGADVMPSYIQYFFNPLLDVPFYLMATHWGARTAGFFLAVAHGLNFILLFLLARAVLGGAATPRRIAACMGLALAGMMGAMTLSELGATFNDNLTSLGVLLSAVFCARNIARILDGPRRAAMADAFLYAIPAGAMVGLKLTAAPWVAGMGLGFLLCAGNGRNAVHAAFAYGAGAAAGFLVTYAWWGTILYTQFGNPLMPYFNFLFTSPLLPADFGNNTMLEKLTGGEAMLYPYLFALEPGRVSEALWRDWRVPVLYTLWILTCGLALFGRTQRPALSDTDARAGGWLLMSMAAAYCAWMGPFRILRYLIPLEMTAPLLIVLCLDRILPVSRKVRLAAAVALVVLLTLTVQPGDWGRRDAWTDRIADINLPPLPENADTLLIMSSHGPAAYSHLLTAFPQHMSFVNLIVAARSRALYRQVHRKIRESKHPLLFFGPTEGTQGHMADVVLKYFRLARIEESCRHIPDPLYRPQRQDNTSGGGNKGYDLCTVGPLEQADGN